MKILFYDCEIIKCIPDKNQREDLEYCGGWHDFSNMGISVIGTWRNFDSFNPLGKYEAFVNHGSYINQSPPIQSFLKFQELANKADLIIGFNSISFDDNLCGANGIKIETNFDLLVEVRKADGQGSGHYQYGVTKSGFALKDLARANLKYNKSSSGELAPVMWQQGKHQEVIDYCIRDVRILKDLYYLFINNQLKSPESRIYEKIIIPYNQGDYLKFNKEYKDHLEWIKEAWKLREKIIINNNHDDDDIPF